MTRAADVMMPNVTAKEKTIPFIPYETRAAVIVGCTLAIIRR